MMDGGKVQNYFQQNIVLTLRDGKNGFKRSHFVLALTFQSTAGSC